MSVEHEFKFVLKPGPVLVNDLREAASIDKKPTSGSVYAYSIDQGYLHKGSRVRCIKPVYLPGIPTGADRTNYRFTYKHKLSKQPGDLEIECDIEEEDFVLAWDEAENKLYKVRVVLPMGNFLWEVDQFYQSRDHFVDGLPPYLVLAEVEVPKQFDHIKSQADIPLHPIIEKHLLFAVPEDDNRFSNRKLGDTDYVAKVLKGVISG